MRRAEGLSGTGTDWIEVVLVGEVIVDEQELIFEVIDKEDDSFTISLSKTALKEILSEIMDAAQA